jgi:type IV pilus assembly protein PilW
VHHRQWARGFNLPELMLSLALGLLLLAAFLKVLQHCRREFSANESVASLEDSARQALAILGNDIEHAGFYGFTNAPDPRLVRAGGVIADAAALRQPDASRPVPAVAGLPAGSHECGSNFAVDLALVVQGSNNTYAAGSDATACAPAAAAGGARAGADTLTVRHASLQITDPHAGRLQIFSRRLESHGVVSLFADGIAPGAVNADAEIRDLEVRSYYVANDSVGRPGWPALRVKALTEARGAAQFRDEEVLPGVEDLQVEFAVTDPLDPDHGIYFVEPGFPRLPDLRVLAVRVWLRIRANSTEAGFLDSRALDYADAHFAPDPLEARLRRRLVERTIALRNARMP